MSPISDDPVERFVDVDEDTFEALLSGRRVDRSDSAPLVEFVHEVRAATDGIAPIASPQLARLLTEGFSTDNGDLLATAASNAHGSASQRSGLPKWRQIKMRIAKALAGIGIAAKVAMGVGVAAASVTGAGAAGVLPGPAQSAVANVVEHVTPFSFPDGSGSHGPNETAAPPDRSTSSSSATGEHPAPPPTTEKAGEEPVPTTVPPTGGAAKGDTAPGAPGVTDLPPTEPSTTAAPPTTERHVAHSIALECKAAFGPKRVVCNWSGIPDGAARVVLLRVADGEPGRVPYSSENTSVTTCSDTTVQSGKTYGYRVDALAADGSVLAASPMVYVTIPT
jgi:hypothetical protein